MTAWERKRVAIMFTDIHGYSRLMSLDETRALQLLSQHDAIVEGVVRSHGGQVLKKMGDAVFAAFDSALAALECAIAIQGDLKKHNDAAGRADRIIIRIGLHLGDVVLRENDLFGEDVNVAARLEPLAEPGGICISEALYDAVSSHAGAGIVKVGDVELKNILRRYVIYKIPSLYGDEFAKASGATAGGRAETFRYSVKSVVNLPVGSLSALDLCILSLGLCAGLLFALDYAILGTLDPTAVLSVVRDRPVTFLALLALLTVLGIHFYASKSVRVVFDDVRDVDSLLEFLVARIGYRAPLRTDDGLVFRPSLRQFILYSARAIRARSDGSSVILTGNTMFVVKLIRMIRSCEAR